MSHWADHPVPAQRHEALYGDRVVSCFAERPMSFHALFDAAHRQHPEADAMVFEGRRWSYAQTADEAMCLAAGFAARGLVAGDRVLMLLNNRPEFVTVLLALQHLGAIAVPVGVREQRPGLSYIAGQCGAKGIVFDDHLAERVPLAADAPALQLRLAAGELDALGRTAAPVPPVAPTRETDVAVILYTSGTTGHPKGAMLNHLCIVHSVLHYQACMRMRPGERSALAVPASHVTGLIAIIAAMWQVGGAVVIVPEFKAEAFVQLMARERVTHTMLVPAMYKLCLMSPGFDRADLSAWRIGGYGGAPMPVATIDELAARLPGLTLHNAYGATETTSPTTLMPAGQTRDHADSVGAVLPAADVRVMDDDGRELPPGETGELWIAGPMVVPGYWANPEATAASFTAGYWHSGRPRFGRCAGLRARVRPQEGHAQPRRLQDLFGRGRERADGGARRDRSGHRRPRLPGAGRAGARVCPCPGHATRRSRAAGALRRAAGRLQGAGDLQLQRRTPAAQRQRQADEAAVARHPDLRRTTMWHDDHELFALMRQRLFPAVVGDILDTMGCLKQFLTPTIRPLRSDMVIIGRAMPVLEANCFAAHEPAGQTPLSRQAFGLLFQALDDLKANEVYIATGCSANFALWGGLMTTRAHCT